MSHPRDTTEPAATAIVADRLIDGSGRDPVPSAVVVCEGDRIVAAGGRRKVPVPAGARVIEDDDLTLLPGFMDMHVHLEGTERSLDFTSLLMTPRSLHLLSAVPNCLKTLQAGITTVRDAGYTPASVRIALERGLFPGPRVQLAVSILSQTGGHGDAMMPCGSLLHFDSGMDIPSGVVDGANGMRQKVREVLRAGADWIKLCTSGGVLSASDEPESAQFTLDEIRAAVEEAAAQRKRCMAHAMSAEGVKNAVRAGVVSIEHGCLLDEECIDLMRSNKTWLVPTLVAPGDVMAAAERRPGGLPGEIVEKARRLTERHRASFRAALEGGVRIAMGTDTAIGPHGQNLRELALMVELGMSPMQAIVASTLRCAELLQIADAAGTVEPGKLADVVAVRGDPLADIALLADRDRIRLVLQRGRPVRDETARAGR